MNFTIIKTKKAAADIPLKQRKTAVDPDVIAALEATAEAQFGVKVDCGDKTAARVRAVLMKYARKLNINIQMDTTEDEKAVVIKRLKGSAPKKKSVGVVVKSKKPEAEAPAEESEAEDTSEEGTEGDSEDEEDE